MIGAKPLRIRFDKVNGFDRVYDGTKYLILLGLKKYDAIYKRIRYPIELKCVITYICSSDFGKIKIDSVVDLPLEKTLTLRYVIIHIRSVFNKDQNHY